MSTVSDEDLTRLLDELASSYDVPEHGPDDILAAIAEAPPALPIVRRRWVQLSAAAAVITAGAVVAASVYGGGNDANTTMSTAAKAPDARVLRGALAPDAKRAPGTSFTSQVGAAASAGVAGSGSAASGGAAIPAPAAGDVSAPMMAPQAPAVVKVGAPVTDQGDSRVVKTGSIALVVKDKQVSSILTAVERAAELDGGYVSDGTTNEYGDTPSGELTIRVPVDKFEDLVARVRGLDAKVRTATTSGKDVTAAYSDLQAQLKTLNATRDRFYLILAKTRTIPEILTVQQRIDNVSGQIDQIEGQRKLLANQSDLATLTVSVSEAGDPVVKATTRPRSGLSQAFQNAKDGFVSGVEAIISHSGRALLWLLCIGAIVLFVRGGWRVARRRMV